MTALTWICDNCSNKSCDEKQCSKGHRFGPRCSGDCFDYDNKNQSQLSKALVENGELSKYSWA